MQSEAWLETAAGDRITLHGTCSIGRSSSSHIALADPCISRRHALIQQQNEHEFWLVDLGSSNGIKLNGRRLSQPSRLKSGDVIGLLNFAFTFRDNGLRAAATPTDVTQHATQMAVEHHFCWLVLTDIEGSSRLAHDLPPDELAQIVGGWLLHCRDDIESVGGTVNKYLGDGLFAYFVDSNEAPLRVRQLVAKLAARQGAGKPPFRIVLHFGQVTMGGASASGEESLLGPEINFIFRLEKVAGGLREPITLSDAAGRRWPHPHEIALIGAHAVPSYEGEHPLYAVKLK